MKVVLVSVAEGDDKPLKYPGMFRRSSLMIVTKTDLLAHCEFAVSRAVDNARQINGGLEMLQLCCKSGDGLHTWYDWLNLQVAAKRA
jgi:hydrogenase nickel incorporation protein HypB